MATPAGDAYTDAGARVVAERMGEAADRFLAALAPDQRARAVFALDDETERTRWFYTPNPRHGLPFTEMDRRQRRLAHQLVAAGLSRAGYVTATTIIGLESTLDAFEHWEFPEYGRDPQRYYISIFDKPDASDAWGWRFEGHHVSLNYVIAGGRVVSPTPTFFGSNPAEAPLGATALLRPLAGVEDLARELMRLLDDTQRATALLAPVAPPDIVVGNRPYVVEGALPLPTPVLSGASMTEEMMRQTERAWRERGLAAEDLAALRYSSTPRGLPARQLNRPQREVLGRLIKEYIGRMPDELAEIELARLSDDAFDTVHVAWAGSLEPHQPHYYRLQGTRFLVEYDNTQNDANHIHSVWRDPLNDFGADLLARHYATSHRA